MKKNQPTFINGARLRVPALVLGSALLLVACGKNDPAAAGPQGAGAPPPTVGVVVVQPGSQPVLTELPGRLEAFRIAQVRARATGVVQRRLFTEGGWVNAGQPLFQIDSAPYQAALQSARASLARAQASLGQTSAQARRFAPLAAANAISKQEYDNALAAEKASRAEVQAAQAAVRTANINLGYARVTAPISGRIGKALVTEGAMVSATEGTQLAVIQQTNPMVVNFTQSASELLKLRTAAGATGVGANPEVNVLLEDGSVYAHRARLLFTDVTVDQATGQVNLRAEVPNPEGLLLPGLYVRVQIEQARMDNVMLLPQQAVTRGNAGDTVLVVKPDGSFGPRPVKVGPAQGSQWIILSGLQPGEQVIVDGVMKLRPGMQKVKAVPWQAPGAAAPAGAASAPAGTASGVASWPGTTTVALMLTPSILGRSPNAPADTWAFCSRMALATSAVPRLKPCSLAGSTQMRMARSAPNSCAWPMPGRR